MELKLNLLEAFDVYRLFVILGNKRRELEQQNFKHEEMVRLLVGNESNEFAKGRLEHENHCIRMHNDEIEMIDNLINQLEPMVDKVIGK